MTGQVYGIVLMILFLLLEESQRKQLNDAYNKANKVLEELQQQSTTATKSKAGNSLNR
ncbi:hypothetical protein LNP74_16535 [Klebsiella pneumoniae subsp. pneumoniae]|nr:hypothetical protein [Klebsiella pneumoniae subsp. pneumoniae]